MYKSPTDKQRKYVELITDNKDGKTKAQCAIEAGYSARSATKNTGQIEKGAFIQELMKNHVKPDRLSQLLQEGTEAKKLYIGKDYSKEYPDWSNRHKFITTILELYGIKDQEKTEINTNYNFSW